jgi:hypothetical protein
MCTKGCIILPLPLPLVYTFLPRLYRLFYNYCIYVLFILYNLPPSSLFRLLSLDFDVIVVSSTVLLLLQQQWWIASCIQHWKLVPYRISRRTLQENSSDRASVLQLLNPFGMCIGSWTIENSSPWIRNATPRSFLLATTTTTNFLCLSFLMAWVGQAVCTVIRHDLWQHMDTL